MQQSSMHDISSVPQKGDHIMNEEDAALCLQAIELANAGKKQAAYKQFSRLYSRGNTEDVTLLFWLAHTTPSLAEANRTMEKIERLEPDHPKLPEVRGYVAKKMQ